MNKQRRALCYVVTIAVGGLVMASSLWAQPPRNGNQQPRLPDSTRIVQMVEDLATELSLTAEQQEAVSVLHFEHFEEVAALIETPHADRESHRKAMETLRSNFQEQVAALLTDAQKDKYEALVKDRGDRRGQQRPRRP